MMRCEEILERLNARRDGELRHEDAATVDEHLATCAPCRAEADALQAIDAELRGAFVSQREAAARIASSTIAALRATDAQPRVDAPIPVCIAWLHAAAGLAAGFVLALVLFRSPLRSSDPATTNAVVTNVSAPIARLAASSGVVECRPEPHLDFLACPQRAPIAANATVRTGPSARCEIAFDDGNALRLDCNTEVTLRDRDIVEVSHGRLYSCSRAPHQGLEVQSATGKLFSQPMCDAAVDCQPQGVRLIVVDGAARVETAERTVDLGAGEQMRIVDGKIALPPFQCDTALETAWVNSLLALNNDRDPELNKRVRDLLANIGAAKLSYLYEDELRRLGDSGVPPLLAYLDSTRATPELSQRTIAARIVSDVALPRWIPDLVVLLTDKSPEVRYHAARGLQRLSGRDQGCNLSTWRAGDADSCQDAYQRWRTWWNENRNHYPEARSDIPQPKSPLF